MGPSLSSSSGCASSLSLPQCDHFVGCKICWAVRAVSCVDGQLHAMFFPSLLMPSMLSTHPVHLRLCAACSLACDVIHSSCDVDTDDHIIVRENISLCISFSNFNNNFINRIIIVLASVWSGK